jgi:hypothetical protein
MEALWFSKAKETSDAKINWKGSYFTFLGYPWSNYDRLSRKGPDAIIQFTVFPISRKILDCQLKPLLLLTQYIQTNQHPHCYIKQNRKKKHVSNKSNSLRLEVHFLSILKTLSEDKKIMFSFICYIGSLKSIDTAKYFQNGLAEIVEIRPTIRSVEILSSDIFLNFLRSFILKIQG